ncbi:MAG: hypothetical protein H6623_05470 [Bdellovibrionaceae bacterium]|nr:hypothetical protein [Pseudobdellovibrionaceae bacterium]
MNIIKNLFAFLILILSSPSVFAALKQLDCKTVKNINLISKHCDDNPNYIKASNECLKSYEAHISTETNLPIDEIKKASEETYSFYLEDDDKGDRSEKKEIPKSSITKNNPQTTSKNKTEDQDDTEDDLTPARKQEIAELKAKIKLIGKEKIDALIKSAKNAKTSTSEYKKNILYPEDWDAPEEVIGNSADFIDSQPCYSNAKDSIEDDEYSIDAYVDLLTQSKTL